MEQKQNIHFKGYENFLARLDDYMSQVEVYRKVFTPFLTPEEQEIAKRYIGKKKVISFDGGYVNAEHKRACISFEELNIPSPIVCLKAIYNEVYDQLRHQDVYGAIMNIGITRQQFGDILVDKGTIYVFTTKETKKVIIDQVTKVKRCYVTFEEVHEEIDVQSKFSYQIVHVSSFRLDVLVSSIAHVSREKSKQMIKMGLIKVNQIPLEESTFLCNNNCILSIRGYGRFQIKDLERTTRSNRYCVEVAKFE